jgi:hypothetical protein
MFDLFEVPIERLEKMVTPVASSPPADNPLTNPTVPSWYRPSGPTFGPARNVQKRAKGTKKALKAARKLGKLTKTSPFGGNQFGRDFEQACSKEALARLRSVEKNGATTATRMWALTQLDAAAHICNGVDPVGKSAKLNKAAKRLARERRERLERQALSGDVYARARALDVLCPIGGSY